MRVLRGWQLLLEAGGSWESGRKQIWTAQEGFMSRASTHVSEGLIIGRGGQSNFFEGTRMLQVGSWYMRGPQTGDKGS